MFGNLISTESYQDAPPVHLCKDFHDALVAHLDATSLCSHSSSTDSSSDDEYHGPVSSRDTGATGSYVPRLCVLARHSCHGQLRQPYNTCLWILTSKPCERHPWQPGPHLQQGPVGAIPNVGKTRLPSIAATIGNATPQSLYTLDMNTILCVLCTDVLSSGEAKQPDRQTSRDHANDINSLTGHNKPGPRNHSYENLLGQHTNDHPLLEADSYDH